jgi:nucleoside-diphosphate-sugar epimerase
MKILVVGGTRLLGKAVVMELFRAGHAVTVLSRAKAAPPAGIEFCREDREPGIRRLAGKQFDVVIDFLAYEGSAVRDALSALADAGYILVSSTWMARLCPGMAADAVVSGPAPGAVEQLPVVTRKYLLGKLGAEAECLSFRSRGRAASVLRLPIFWDVREHTGRLDFYCARVLDGAPSICVDGGHNRAQILWVADAASVIAAWCQVAAERPIWEALPDEGIPVRKVVEAVGAGLGVRPSIVDISREELAARLPGFLDAEPLWREQSRTLTEANIFRRVSMRASAPADWLSRVSSHYNSMPQTTLRMEELRYLGERGA